MIRLGYAGTNTLLPSASKTFRLANYSEKRMLETSRNNLLALKDILEWNKEHDIFLFRITSDLIPYGSSKINSGSWKKVLKNDFTEIGQYIKENGMRVSMHPGQYSVINSPNHTFYKNALSDFAYHNSILQLMKLDNSHRIVIHGGGTYNDKEKSLSVLKERLLYLDPAIKSRLALENDDMSFNAEDILKLSSSLGIPAVFDVFHHKVLPSFTGLSDKEIIFKFSTMWKNERQKIHYSNQDPKKRRGSHSRSVDPAQFLELYRQIKDLETDIMLEVKDKQESVLKLRKLISELM